MKTLRNTLFLPLLLSLLTAIPAQASPATSCKILILNSAAQSAEVQALVLPDAFKQWLLWEQTANVDYFRKDQAPVELPVAMIPANQTKIEILPGTPDVLTQTLVQGQNVAWIKHLWNTEAKTPNFNAPQSGSLPAYLTASRSVVFADPQLQRFSIKLPTDHPHGPKGQLQSGKVDTSDDVRVAILRSQHIQKTDARIGNDPNLILLLEVATISDPNSRIGAVIRDLGPIQDGNYYLPALSIPYVGREIAKINGQSFEAFWQKNYAELLGEAKAKLLLRYGLQMETPNAQNMLIQFDRNLRPTGRLVFRDLSDAVFVDSVTRGMRLDQEVLLDWHAGYGQHDYIKPYWSNSSWRFDEAGKLSVSDAALNEWGIAHNNAYVLVLARELGFTPEKVNINSQLNSLDEMKDVYDFLKSPAGQELLEKFRKARDAGVTAPVLPNAA